MVSYRSSSGHHSTPSSSPAKKGPRDVVFRYKQCQHTGNLILNDTRPMPALRVLIGHWNFRLCQGLCRIIADPTISTMYPTIETQSHSSFVNPTFPFSISLFPFWIPLSVYIKISIPLFQVIPLPLYPPEAPITAGNETTGTVIYNRWMSETAFHQHLFICTLMSHVL